MILQILDFFFSSLQNFVYIIQELNDVYNSYWAPSTWLFYLICLASGITSKLQKINMLAPLLRVQRCDLELRQTIIHEIVNPCNLKTIVITPVMRGENK